MLEKMGGWCQQKREYITKGGQSLKDMYICLARTPNMNMTYGRICVRW